MLLTEPPVVAKLCDFGLGRLMKDRSSQMTTMNLKGSWGYICPEYARTGKVGPGSDVYSLGVVLLELMTGAPAFESGRSPPDLASYARKRRGRAGAAVSGETRARVARVVTLQESSLQSFLALAPKRFVSAYARHAALDCVHEAAALRGRVLADDEDDADHAEYFALQSCRIDSLQAMMDDLQAAILADALASQRAALWRLLYLGAPLVGVLLAGAYLGLLGLVAFVRYQDSVAERLDRLRSSERKYKKLLTTWVPLKEWIAGAAPPSEAA